MNIPVPDNGVPVKLGDPSYVYKDVYHPIMWINELPYRPRVETLIIKDGTMVYLRLKKDKGSSGTKGEYELPGGSIDADSSKIEQAKNEVNEEALMSIKDIYDAGIQYYENYPDGFIMGGGDTPLEYKGHISDVFVAKYSGIYDVRAVEKKDLDPKIANNGKFYRITDVAKILKKEHCEALLNCPFVKVSTKGALRILAQMKNSGTLQNLKDIAKSDVTEELVVVSKYDRLTTIPCATAGKDKDWKKVSVFRSIKNAIEDFFIIDSGQTWKNNTAHLDKILYVYAIDEPHKELTLYTPSNEDSPCAKVTGELWIKSASDNISVKRLGMIRVESTGHLSHFYGGKNNSRKYEVAECNFKWIVKDITTKVALESASPTVPGNKLYHGTVYEISKFEPRSLNLGNAMEEPGWVTFAFADYTLALRFGLMRAIQKAKDYWGKKITCSWDLSESKPYISAEDFNKVSYLIPGFQFFVYTIDATNLEVGIGNDDRLQEYTFSESGITPEKEDILRIDSAMLREHLIIVPDSKIKEYKKNQEVMAKYGHPRGWYGAFMTRDYNNGDASHKLQSACWDGNLNPGDDIREYMNAHGISFDDDVVNLSASVNESTYDNDTPMKSTMLPNFKKNAPRKLSSFKKLKITQSVANKYKNKTRALQNMDPTEEGYVFVDGEEFVAVVVVDTGRNGTGDLKDYNWITYIEVDKKYRGCGLSRQLLDVAVKELKGDFLTVTYDNEVAINLYKSYGFRIGKNSYDEIKSGKSKSKMYTMFYKDRVKGIELVDESATPVTENLLISKGVFDVNFEDFESGKSNVVLVTGLSGSGKTTLGTKVADKYGAELIELDCFECCYQFETDEQLRQAGEVFWQYLSSHKNLWIRLKERSVRGKELGVEIDKFLRYAISWCKKDTSAKYVIEGVQIYSFLNKENISETPLLIVGTSALKSIIRRLYRTRKTNKEDFKKELSELPQCIVWYLDENKQFEKFKKSVLESTIEENSNISYSTDENHVVEIIDSLPKYEKKFIGNRVGKDFSTKYVSHTQNLKYREVLLVDKEPVAFLDVYTMPGMKDTEGEGVLAVKSGGNYRHKGYGSMLIERMEKCITKKTGITTIIWEYDIANTKSASMGLALGYRGSSKKLLKVLESIRAAETGVLEAAEYSSKNKYPVFITLMHTGTPMATFIKKMTGDEFSHATISFNVRLSPQYSFGTKKLGGKERGLVIHGTRDPFYDQFKTTYATYVMYVSKEQREKMLTRLQWFVEHEETLKYDALALGACFLHIPTEFRRKYFCSRFVMEVIGEGQPLSKVPSLWKPQEISYLNNISLVNAGDDFRHYDYRVTSANLNLIKENRQNEIHVEVPVTESTRSNLPNELFGLPEHRKYPLDTEKHVKSAIKFFNYVSPDNEEELAQNILKRIDELGMGAPAVTKRNRFIKYVEESYQQALSNTPKRADWSLLNTLSDDDRRKTLRAASKYVNDMPIYANTSYIGKELVGSIYVFRDHEKEDFGHIFIITDPKFTNFSEIEENLLHEAEIEFTDPMWGISTYVTESCKDLKTAREFLQKVDKLGEKYNANFFIVTDGASMTRNSRGSNPAVKHCRNAQKEWERENGFDPDEDWLKDGTIESIDIFESGYFKEYAQYADLDAARSDVIESSRVKDPTQQNSTNFVELSDFPISETWIPLMEAPRAIDKDNTGDSAEDYTVEVEEPDNTPENEPQEAQEEEDTTDYTEDVEEPENEETNLDGQDEGTDDFEMDEPTDYTSDAEGSEGDDAENTDGTNDDGFDSTDTDSTNKNGNLFDNNVLKNYSLLRNFEKLYELTKEVSDSLDAKVEPTKLQNMVLAQVLKNLNSIKEFILSYVKFQFSEDDYSQNLYYCKIVVQALKLNLELLKRNRLLGENK